MVKAAFAPAGGCDELQEAVLGGLASALYGIDLADVPIADDEAVANATHEERLHAVHLMVVLEFVEHPLSTRVELPVEQYAHGLGVSLVLLRDARKLAKATSSGCTWTSSATAGTRRRRSRNRCAVDGRSSSVPSSRTPVWSPTA